jgi:hypothetical protein
MSIEETKATNEAKKLFNKYYIDLESEVQDLVDNEKILNIALDQSIKAVDVVLDVLNNQFEEGLEVKHEIKYWVLVKESLIVEFEARGL